MPLVSVIIPTFNYGKFISRAINSIFSQSFNDFDIIVVDHGSTDNTRDIVTSFGGVLRYINQEKKGAAFARNVGIEVSTGKYIGFLDADDYFDKDNLRRKIEILETCSSVGWVYSDWQYIDDNGNYLGRGSIRFNYSNKNLNP